MHMILIGFLLNDGYPKVFGNRVIDFFESDNNISNKYFTAIFDARDIVELKIVY